ncbi:MAG: DUF2909 family protein [Pseudomonadales bacterium]|nr:DUF2909 family protein [Pseudomonadales bacterium]
MWLKVIIIILLIGNVLTLGLAFVTLIKEQGRGGKRTANWLLTRVTLAALLLLAVTYGVWSGDLGISAPWHHPIK